MKLIYSRQRETLSQVSFSSGTPGHLVAWSAGQPMVGREAGPGDDPIMGLSTTSPALTSE